MNKFCAALGLSLSLVLPEPAAAQAEWSGVLSNDAADALNAPFDGRGEDSLTNFAPGIPYGPAGAPRPAQLSNLGPVRLWTSVFVGRSSLAGDADGGTEPVSASMAGTTIGADSQFDAATLLGASLGVSRQTFSSGSDHGDSNDVTLTLYAHRTLTDRAYVSAALGLGWHDVATHRTGLILIPNELDADYHSHDVGGRLEAGYAFSQTGLGAIAPYAAFVGDAYHQPAYGETASSGPSFLALSYQPSTIGITHTELGARYGNVFAGGSWSIDAVAAWEHELDDNPFVQASFQTRPGTDFVLRGTKPATDTALLGAGLRYQVDTGFTFGARSDARLGPGTTILSATVDATFRW